jgi:hypothetical protein
MRMQPHIQTAMVYTVLWRGLWHPMTHKHTTPLSHQGLPVAHPGGPLLCGFSVHYHENSLDEYLPSVTKRSMR